MGVSQSKCISLKEESSLLEDSYTVIRTSGESETGWTLSAEPHECAQTCNCTWNYAGHANLGEQGWRVFLANGPGDNHGCGWRRLGTFWPSRLEGDQTAIDAWTAELKTTLERLATERGLPTRWLEHTCGRGAPEGYCSGCSNERQARAAC
jgi:hypothetical protein